MPKATRTQSSPTPRETARARRRADAAPRRARRGLPAVGIGLIVVACVIALAMAFRTMRGGGQGTAPTAVGGESSESGTPQVRFTDVTREAGIHFVHENGARGEKLLPETMGGGCAFFDYDADGDQDLLLVNSRPWPDDARDAEAASPTMALYRNDGRGRFEDVTVGSGLDVALGGMAAAVGDYDNDGRVDVFLSAVGANKLFHNKGSGKFLDVTGAAGVAGDADEWSSGCGWLDYDADGDLDLFVCNYVEWSAQRDAAQHFRLPDGRPAYGRPQNFAGTFPYLYRNDGEGKFTDVSRDAGVQVRDPFTGAPASKALGVTFNDFDGDGWIDVVVANDTVPNQLFRNRGDGTFEEIGALAGVAFDANGNTRGAMGIDSAHFRNDDALGIAVGNFTDEMTALYVSHAGGMQFFDIASAAGLGLNTRAELTFGVFYFDYDLDGRLDLFAANGHLEPEIARVHTGRQYEQSPQLFWNSGSAGSREFQLVAAENAGSDLVRPIVGRGAAFADIDGDGDLDVLITATGQAPRLLRNDQNLGHHWLRLKLKGTNGNRDAIGAQVDVRLGDRTLRRQVMPTRSYLSQVELPLTFGLGNTDRVQSVTIRWPDGSRQVVRDLRADYTYEINQQSGAATAAAAQPRNVLDSRSARDQSDGTRRPIVGSEALSTCGHYLHYRDRAAPAEDAVPAQPVPCEGPTCSDGPLDHKGVPCAPLRRLEPPQHAWTWAEPGARCGNLSHLLLPDPQRPPNPVRSRLFRPPKSC